ncbi:MAG: amidohydrolase family protein, partial [Desulfomonilaceae bacterium]
PGPRWKTRPPEAEIRAVEKILELTAKLGLHSHICHVSTERAVSLIQDYNRTSEDRVTCEVTPHHLFFSVQDGKILAAGEQNVPASALLECNPPMRPESDRLFLFDALKEGVIDVLASDHAPHTMDDKRNGSPGMPHLDTLGPFAGWLMNQCGFPPVRVAEVLSTAPARLFDHDLDLPHGTIGTGYAASLTILDIRNSMLVEGNRIEGRGALKTLCGWSPFEGVRLPARVAGTVVRGKQYVF